MFYNNVQRNHIVVYIELLLDIISKINRGGMI